MHCYGIGKLQIIQHLLVIDSYSALKIYSHSFKYLVHCNYYAYIAVKNACTTFGLVLGYILFPKNFIIILGLHDLVTFSESINRGLDL